MQTARILSVLGIFALLIFGYELWGRSGAEVSLQPATRVALVAPERLTEMQPVKEIELETHSPEIPAGPGYEPFMAQCVVCHSARYVLNQPVFPRKTWATEVHKMVKVYGAPITVEEEKPLVDYLVVWHGKEDEPAPKANAK